MKRTLFALSALATHAAELRVGSMPGPYRDAFAKGIAPQLEKKGYTVQSVEFSQGVQPNDAVERGQIDANIFQHTIYLEANNKSQQFALVPVVHVPTPPMGLYSKRWKTLAQDPVNAARALRILAAAGRVTNRPGDAINISERDLSANPKKLKLVPLDAAQAPRSLDDADLSAIQANFAIAYGLKLTEALKLEDMTLPDVSVVAVKRSNKNAKFAQDIVVAYRSPEFQKFFEANPVWKGYRVPDDFSTTVGSTKP